jgi:2-dehydropantoate 2-reductase
VRVVIFGAGAVGSFLGARLSGAGHSVLLIGRAAHVDAIERDGLRIEGRTEGTFRPSARTELRPDDGADLVLLCVKGPDVPAAAENLGRTLSTATSVVALENGLGIERLALDGLRRGGWSSPEPWLIRGLNSYGVTLLGPGRVRHAGDGEIVLPATSPPVPLATLDRTGRLLQDGGLVVRRSDPFAREVWRKALVNAAINPITADQGIENGALAKEPWRGQAERLLREAQAVAAAEGYAFPDGEADRELWRVVRATAPNRSSMLQDLDRGRRTEIDTISGAILTAGARHGLDLPHTRRAVERIHRREAQGPDRPRRSASS